MINNVGLTLLLLFFFHQYCLSAHFHSDDSIIFCGFFILFQTFVLGFVSLLPSFCTSPAPACIMLFICNPMHWYAEGKHVLLALSASVPPSALGRLQVYANRLWILLHVQHHRLPHRLWDSVPAGKLQLQNGSYAWYGFSQEHVLFSEYLDALWVINYTLTLFQTGTSTVCTPEQYKDCADPALGEPTHFNACIYLKIWLDKFAFMSELILSSVR